MKVYVLTDIPIAFRFLDLSGLLLLFAIAVVCHGHVLIWQLRNASKPLVLRLNRECDYLCGDSLQDERCVRACLADRYRGF